jgi:excisionase family DNA binding protein
VPCQLLSAVDAGVVFDVHAETLRRLYRAGRIPGYKIGRFLRFDVEEIREALRTSTAGGAPTISGVAVGPDFDALDAA